MTRGHRAAHRVIWIVVAIAIAAGVALTIAHRPPSVPVPTLEAPP